MTSVCISCACTVGCFPLRISVQHPTADNKGGSRDVVIETSSTSKAIDNLQKSLCNTTIPPLILPSPAPEVPPQNGNLIGCGLSLPNAFQGERGWLKKGLYPKL